MSTTKLWGGCFTKNIDAIFEELNNSINIDKRLWKVDIKGSIEYGKGLLDAKILTSAEYDKIEKAFSVIAKEWEEKSFLLKQGDEDIHTANERRLKELVGPDIGGKIHTGRSRNDQVTTDIKLYIKEDMCPALKLLVSKLIQTLCVRAKEFAQSPDTFLIFPGYTHLQRAQPVAFSHWLLAHAWSFKRDLDKLELMAKTSAYGLQTLTLGSGALAGNPLPQFDRASIASRLNFSQCSLNSMDATGDRDFIVDLLYWMSLVGIHLSKLSEDLLLYSTKEFGYIKLDDAFTTGSSLMPQKKNPDSLEIIRGKCGLFISNLNAMQIILKGLPSTYNKDLQDDKTLLFSSYDTIVLLLDVMIGLISTFKVNEQACSDALSTDMLATDVAYYLVNKKVPFRDAHHMAGNVVALAQKLQIPIDKLRLEELKGLSDNFDSDIENVWNFRHSVQQYQAIGGTSYENVALQIEELEKGFFTQNCIV